MIDRVIEDINNGTLTADKLTHEILRKNYFPSKDNQDRRNELGRGKGILDDSRQLDQYLYSYGQMANQQWDKLFEFSMIDDDTTIIDYGCGQGLSFLNLVCRWSPDGDKTWQDYIKSIVLIEPSLVALTRAQAIAKLKFPDATIRTVNKKLEELDNTDLSFDANKVMIHIFSQVLDIPLADEFDLIAFFENITSTICTHYIHIVSHDVDDDNNQRNILKLYKHIVSEYVHAKVSGDTIRPVFRTPPKEPLKLIKKATNMVLNTFKIQGSNKEYDCIAMFACIKTY